MASADFFRQCRVDCGDLGGELMVIYEAVMVPINLRMLVPR